MGDRWKNLESPLLTQCYLEEVGILQGKMGILSFRKLPKPRTDYLGLDSMGMDLCHQE